MAQKIDYETNLAAHQSGNAVVEADPDAEEGKEDEEKPLPKVVLALNPICDVTTTTSDAAAAAAATTVEAEEPPVDEDSAEQKGYWSSYR